MKKIVIILSIILIIVISNNTTDDLLIPDEAIRIRVIANSNSFEDQAIKKMVKDNLEHEITKILEDANDINDAREIIKSNMNNIEDNVKQTLSNNGYSSEYTINYGYNLFPNKKYKGVTYKEGYYESVVITLGSGSGDNWWCVLFPPLCALESDQNNVGEVEYKSFIKEIIKKYFKN